MTSLLETVSHAKPPKGFSHPVSTQKLSEALADVPQFRDINLHYLAAEGDILGSTVGSEKLHGAAAKKLDGYREFLTCHWNRDDGWRITIHSVPSTRKAAASRVFVEQALPAFKQWLSVRRADSWFIGRRYLQIGLSEFTDEIALREVHNDHVEEIREFLDGEERGQAS